MSFSQQNEQGSVLIHGNDLTDLMRNMNFTQAVYYTWTGRYPSEQEEAMMNACLTAVIDHGPEALTAKTARSAASGGAEMHAAIAAGILAAGKHHGTTPLQKSSIMIQEAIEKNLSATEVVKAYLESGERMPGFGHRVYKDADPRTQVLLQKAEEAGFMNEHVKLALELERELESQKGKKLVLNVDGMIGALLPGLGISVEQAPGMFLMGRLAGLVMHVSEQQKEKPQSMRRV